MDYNLKMRTNKPHIHTFERLVELLHLSIDLIEYLTMIILVVRKQLSEVARILFKPLDRLPDWNWVAWF